MGGPCARHSHGRYRYGAPCADAPTYHQSGSVLHARRRCGKVEGGGQPIQATPEEKATGGPWARPAVMLRTAPETAGCHTNTARVSAGGNRIGWQRRNGVWSRGRARGEKEKGERRGEGRAELRGGESGRRGLIALPLGQRLLLLFARPVRIARHDRLQLHGCGLGGGFLLSPDLVQLQVGVPKHADHRHEDARRAAHVERTVEQNKVLSSRFGKMETRGGRTARRQRPSRQKATDVQARVSSKPPEKMSATELPQSPCRMCELQCSRRRRPDRTALVERHQAAYYPPKPGAVVGLHPSTHPSKRLQKTRVHVRWPGWSTF